VSKELHGGKLDPFPNPAHDLPRLVQAQLGQIVEPHITWDYFITGGRRRRKEKRRRQIACNSHIRHGRSSFNRELLEEESRFEINLVTSGWLLEFELREALTVHGEFFTVKEKFKRKKIRS